MNNITMRSRTAAAKRLLKKNKSREGWYNQIINGGIDSGGKNLIAWDSGFIYYYDSIDEIPRAEYFEDDAIIQAPEYLKKYRFISKHYLYSVIEECTNPLQPVTLARLQLYIKIAKNNDLFYVNKNYIPILIGSNYYNALLVKDALTAAALDSCNINYYSDGRKLSALYIESLGAGAYLTPLRESDKMIEIANKIQDAIIAAGY